MFCICVLKIILGEYISISLIDVIKSFFPVSFGNWYFSAYFPIFFLMPFVNRAIKEISINKSKNILVIFFTIFSIKTIISDNWFNFGHSAFWLLILYIVGALVKKVDLFSRFNNKILILFYVALSFLTWLLNVVFGFSSWGNILHQQYYCLQLCCLFIFLELMLKVST